MDFPHGTASGANTAPLSSDRDTLDDDSNSHKDPRTTTNGPRTIGVKAEGIQYVDRHAVRIITKSDKDEIVIIYAKKGNYYKLPGGGVEKGEDHRIAGEREAMEETGCKVALDRDCFAVTEEWRNDLHQTSYCYAARLVEHTGATELTEDELVDGLQHEWISIRAAIEKMKATQPTSELGRFIRERDLSFVETYADRNGASLPSVEDQKCQSSD
ncbi:hypothetical protein IMSHALPRED_010120 [Imshaugia aleurites]|uniref:Nudix hydrolase domain-containing protein n=1 Tax=Imshaugia aleurites TaxID=172621 RepID=A0A8H3G8Y3_9LECA|nr:hypothetical protein IMSHALPRED_010120 [Imshaugia aleurites]